MGAAAIIQPYQWVFKSRSRLTIPPMLFLLLWPHWQVEQPWLTFGLGGLLFTVGLALRVWAQMHLHYRLPDPMALTATGPFARVRNPIYIANIVLLVGLCFVSKVMVLAPALLVWCAVLYTFVVKHEEASLAAHYGEPYQRYCEQVPRWLPRLTPRPAAASFRPLDYLWPSLVSEAHNLALLALFALKGPILERLI